ncbi:MAG: hypothetical protein QOF16_951 [Actinomycetota bacterium]|jgi:hypothetical protein|nr:hypothetical protein [Actinomycetota bacterium]
MLFFVKQVHTPEHCPVGRGSGPEALFNENADGVEIRFGIVDATRHTMYFLVETDDLDAIRNFLAPGIGHCVTEINPVSHLPAFAP